MTISAEEIDQRVREAYDTGLLEGTLLAKEANQRALNTAKLGLAAMSLLCLVIVAITVFVFAV